MADLDDVESETGILDRVKVEHVAQRAVRQARTENGHSILGRPIADGLVAIDPLSQKTNHFRRRPIELLSPLSLEHLVQKGHQPVLEIAVVPIGHQQIADPIVTWNFNFE